MDGGFTDNLPSQRDTVTVSPFSGEADICPLDPYSSNWMNINVKNTSFQVSQLLVEYETVCENNVVAIPIIDTF
jgi:hypothetical protein